MQPAPVVGGWPLGFLPPHLAAAAAGGMPLNFSHSMTSSKPRVGLGVICRCLSPNGSVECLLLKRGPKFVSPLKWSFPGGRLEEDGHESEDDGERSTIRELEKECGGGTPGGLPPLIHIESYKSGRTLYHVFVIDCDAQTTWCNWQPAVTSKHTGEIDQTSGDLVLQGKNYRATNGFCWTDLQTLIEECMIVGNMDQDTVNSSELQHGLVRWVKANGENILKTLMARSPKLERHRRYPPTGNGSINQLNKGSVSGGRPRSGSTGSRARKPPQDGHLFPNPIIPSQQQQQVFRPPDHYGNQPTHPLIQMGMPIMGGTAGAGDLGGDHTHLYYSPPGGAAGTGYIQSESNTPSQQQSPIKTVGIETDKTGYTPFEGGGGNDSSAITDLTPPSVQQQSSYNTVPDVYSPDYDPSVYPAQPTHPSPQQPTITPQVNVDMTNAIVSPPSHDQHHPRYNQQHTKRSDICRNYLNGHCLYGEKCWFVHSDQKPHREPLLGPGGILNTALAVMQHQPPSMFPGNLPGMDHQYMSSQYVPKSPINGGAGQQVNPSAGVGGNPPAWQLPGVVNRPPPVYPFIPRGFMGPPGGGQPQMVVRPMMYQNRFGIPGQVDHLTVPHIPDPVLRFRLLSEGMIKTMDPDDPDSFVSDISALCVRADHFFVTFSNCLRDYRVMFGSDRPTDNHQLTGEQILSSNVTCLHHSKVTPTLLVIGTADDGVYMFDTKRSGPSNPLTPIHEPQQSSDALVTALVHFTTIAAAQVVVAGNNRGDVTWYIAQPPMKTFTVLSHQKAHTPHPVVSVQTMGSCLISAASNGTVCLWTMKSPEPVLLESFQAHTGSLLNVHVLDTSCFLTVGVNHPPSAETINDTKPSSSPHEGTPSDSTPLEAQTDDPTKSTVSPGVEDIVSTMKNMSINPSSSVSQWEYGNPVKNIRTLDNFGPVTCSAYYQHTLLGNRFLALGLMGGAVKICNMPTLTVASEIHFQDIIDKNCRHIAINLSRDKEHTYNFNFKNPFRDLILTSVWSDGRVMVCQVDPRRIT